MTDRAARCAHCETRIVDPTTQVVHGDKTYCCANCSAAMEQTGSGSDPHSRPGGCVPLCPLQRGDRRRIDYAGQRRAGVLLPELRQGNGRVG
jgi:DNA-directed RNA polymerase subunit RPC12/RpoP